MTDVDRPLTDAQERLLIAVADEVGLSARKVGYWRAVKARHVAEHEKPVRKQTTARLIDRGLIELVPVGCVKLTDAGRLMVDSMGD